MANSWLSQKKKSLHQRKKDFLLIASFGLFLLLPMGCFCLEPYVELKPGYFFFNNSTLSHIFHNGGETTQLEAGVFFNKYHALALNGQYLHKSGTALHSYDKTNITISTLTLFLKGFIPASKNFQPYGGIGPRVFFFKNKNYSPYVPQNNSKNKMGIGIVLGTYVFFKNAHFYIDPFLDYGFTNKIAGKKGNSSLSYRINISGLTVGLGFGNKF
jgi:outer membrane protein W